MVKCGSCTYQIDVHVLLLQFDFDPDRRRNSMVASDLPWYGWLAECWNHPPSKNTLFRLKIHIDSVEEFSAFITLETSWYGQSIRPAVGRLRIRIRSRAITIVFLTGWPDVRSMWYTRILCLRHGASVLAALKTRAQSRFMQQTAVVICLKDSESDVKHLEIIWLWILYDSLMLYIDEEEV